jgi:ribosomal protein S18 acetylase RimI-like enzyme
VPTGVGLDVSRQPQGSASRLTQVITDQMVDFLTYLPSQLSPMEVSISPELVRVDAGIPCDLYNVICRTRLKERTFRQKAADALSHYRNKQFPCTWWLDSDATPCDLNLFLVSEGLQLEEVEVGMSRGLKGKLPICASGLEILPVCTEEQLDAYSKIIAYLSNQPNVVGLFYERAGSTLLAEDSPIQAYIGYLDGRPVSTGALFVSNGVAGIYDVVTLKEVRRCGHASTMVCYLLRELASQGHELVVLQASQQSIGLYRRLGFQPHCEYHSYTLTQ